MQLWPKHMQPTDRINSPPLEILLFKFRRGAEGLSRDASALPLGSSVGEVPRRYRSQGRDTLEPY